MYKWVGDEEGASVTDIQETFKRISNRRPSMFKLKRSKTHEDENQPEHAFKYSKMTINDPYFPVFRDDGVALSD